MLSRQPKQEKKSLANALLFFGLKNESEFDGIKGVKYFTKSSNDDSDFRREMEDCVMLYVEGYKCYYRHMDIYFTRGGMSGGDEEAEGVWSIEENGKIKLTMKLTKDDRKFKKGDEVIKEFSLKQLKKIANGYTF